MKLSITKSKDVVGESGGASFIGSSGIYDATINFASVAVAKSGSESVNFNVLYNGKTQTLWGPTVTNINGEDNDIGSNLILKLGIVAGMDEGEELAFGDETHEVGKDNTEMDFTVIEQFSDLEVKVHVQEEYSLYKGAIKDKLVIKAFFREDGASAEEIVNESEAGVRLAQVEEKYASNITYKDDLTPEAIAEWKANGRGKNGATKAKVNTSTAKKAIFSRNK